jgi:hypothetical protein
MVRSLKFCGLVLVNLAIAVVGTAILDTAVRRMIPTSTVAAIVWKEIILSIVCAAFIGFFMWRTWRSSAAKWPWTLAALWFAFGYLSIAGNGNVWGRLSGFSSGSVLTAPDVRTFFAFTVRSFGPFHTLWAHVSPPSYIAPQSRRPMVVETSPSLTMSVRVKHDLRTPLHALRGERHFALLVGLRISNPGLASNRSGQELSPTQPSLRSQTAIMITSSNSPARGERDTQSLRR